MPRYSITISERYEGDDAPDAPDALHRMHRDYYPRVNAYLIAKMERVVRAIAMQFTLGEHEDPDGLLGRLTGTQPSETSKTQNSGRPTIGAGVNVHVGPAIDGRDRKRLERLCRVG